AAMGHINMFPDHDGTLRWESLLIAYDDHLYPSLALISAARHLGTPLENIRVDAARSVATGKSLIPTDQWGRTLINYYGPSGSFPHYPVCDILDGKVRPEQLANRIILIGATAVGIYDLRVTPYSAAMPGIEKHAAVAASILEGRYIRQAPPGQNLAVLLISGLLLTWYLTGARVLSASLAAAAGAAAISVTAVLLFSHKGLWINLACPVFNLAGIYICITAYNYWSEERFSRNIRRMFSSYVTERVVSELIKNPQMAKLGGERRVITVLFSDIRGFTTFSEKHSPTEVVSVLNEYLGAMTEVIFKWEGTLDKFVGDEIMVFWSAPMPQEDHAELAVRCALDMRRQLSELQQKWISEGKPPLDAGIGINSGEVLVGNIGAEGKKMDYTVIGDHVNLGARVEALTRRFEQPILLTEYTLEQLRPRIESGALTGMAFDGLGKVIVKGKQQPVGLYTARAQDNNSAPSSICICSGETITVMAEK
ncbi:MAG TPA: adenylate/guanylate cyclase domain-containing protein, partial [Deltaproteobacteria bacterium]|nr:adenylate/guanylate cyclase domain-containing protein [Deltaproteobacteria bacterium]